MPTITHAIEIKATPEQIWAVASDMTRYGEWNTTHTGFPDGAPSLQASATFKEKVTIMGMPGEATWTVVELEPAARLVLDGSGPMGVTLGQRLGLSPAPGGTTVSFAASFEGGAIAGPIGDAVAKSAQHAAADSLAKLSRLVSS